MKSIRLIGDVHGKVHQYSQIIAECPESICVGDFGFKREWDWITDNMPYQPHYIVMCNHDYHPYRNTHYNSLGIWQYTDQGIFTVAGANSVDKHLRTEGLDWFRDEELNVTEQLEAFDAYVRIKPEIVISHDCPQMVMEKFFGYTDKTSTRGMLQHMLDVHKPRLWVFGHHHKHRNELIGSTRFICLEELQWIDINI